jgi:hypothetical protein
MSEAVLSGSPIENLEEKPSFLKGKQAFTLLGLLGGGALWLYLMFGGSTSEHHYVLNSYMYGYIFWLLLTTGALGLSLLHNSIKSSWTLAVLRIFEAGSSWQMWAVLAFFFIPVATNMKHVYEWADPAHLDYILKKKQPYLNVPFFFARMAVYFVFFAWISTFLRKSTNRHDKNQDPNEFQLRTNIATPMMVVFFIFVTFMISLNSSHFFDIKLGCNVVLEDRSARRNPVSAFRRCLSPSSSRATSCDEVVDHQGRDKATDTEHRCPDGCLRNQGDIDVTSIVTHRI